MRSRISTPGRARGSVLVEISLVFVLFAILVLGIMDFAQFLFHQQLIVERVRAAARWGAVVDPSDITAIRDKVLYAQPVEPGANATASFGLTPAMVTVSAPDAGADAYRLVVTVSGYSYRALSPWLAGSYAGAPITVVVPVGRYN